jgi:hypothetical protein
MQRVLVQDSNFDLWRNNHRLVKLVYFSMATLWVKWYLKLQIMIMKPSNLPVLCGCKNLQPRL